MRPYLVVVRADDDSRHPEWLEGGGSRNFDLFVSYFGNKRNSFKEGADYYEAHPGMKWPRLYEIVKARRQWFLGYRACWFADDDLSSNARNLSAMFALFSEFELWLAQPALGPGSSVTVPITRQVDDSRLRFTNYVDVMCPLFASEVLGRLAETFDKSVSGWGLDYLWPKLLEYPRDRIAVLDETPVIHTRRHGTGKNYEVCKEMGISPRVEFTRIFAEHGIRSRPVAHTLVRPDGSRVALVAPRWFVLRRPKSPPGDAGGVLRLPGGSSGEPSAVHALHAPRFRRRERDALPVQPAHHELRSSCVAFDAAPSASHKSVRRVRVYLSAGRGEHVPRNEPCFTLLSERGRVEAFIAAVRRRRREWIRSDYVGVFVASGWASTGLTSADLGAALDARGFRHDVYALARFERQSIARKMAALHPLGERIARHVLIDRLGLPERILKREIVMVAEDIWLARPQWFQACVERWLAPARAALDDQGDAELERMIACTSEAGDAAGRARSRRAVRSGLLGCLASASFSHSGCKLAFFAPRTPLELRP